MLLDVQVFEVFRSGERFILGQEFPGSDACYIGAYRIPLIRLATFFFFFFF